MKRGILKNILIENIYIWYYLLNYKKVLEWYIECNYVDTNCQHILNGQIIPYYGYGFYGYKGTSIVGVATDCISVGDIIDSHSRIIYHLQCYIFPLHTL